MSVSKLRPLLRLLPLVCVAAGIFTPSGTVAATPPRINPGSALERNMSIFNHLLGNLDRYYVDSLDADKAVRRAIDAMLSGLDPYTEFYTEAEQREFESSTKGEYGGIGIRIAVYDGEPYFSSPTPGYPAQLAGLRTGDRVVRVDTVSTVGKGSDFVSGLVRGQAGTPVTVTVSRPSAAPDSLITVTLERALLHMPAVEYSTMLPGGIGYIHLTTFSEKSAQEVGAILREFKKDRNLRGVVLDLTNNGGGLLTQATEIAGMFLPRGTRILETRSRDGVNDRVYRTTKDPILPDIPLAVLINSGSASASEVVAGALQDLDRAVLVGERSFGKGLVQSTMSLPYSSLLKVTTAKYYIPSGRLIQAADYSHRQEDGRPSFTPDSLAGVFHTLNGREVRDGGGLQPDVRVPDTVMSPYLMYNLVRSPYLFRFANAYAATHADADPDTFTLSDSLFNAFKATIPPTFNYNTDSRQGIDYLRRALEAEGSMSPAVTAALDSLRLLTAPDLNRDLDRDREAITSMLVPMIVEHYHSQEGESRAELRYSKELAEAVSVLSDPARYRALLRPAASGAQGADRPVKGGAKSGKPRR